jgi:Periplasmic copper-binding protein (NosD)/Bacterial Ig domain
VAHAAVDDIGHRFEDTFERAKRTLILFAALLSAVTGCTDSRSSEAPAGPPASSPLSVRFLGPQRLTKPTLLEAKAAARRSRVVAVTFILDGRPLGSDTTKPYALDVEPALLAAGSHRLRVDAVDNLGRRRSTKPVDVTVEASESELIEASPGPSFAKAREALERGGVTVRLAPGRYEVDQLRLGSRARLVGSGPRTVIAPASARYWSLVVARGRGIRISDLTVDGGRGPELRDGGIAIAVFDGSSDVRLQRLRIERVRTHGVNVWGAHSSITVQDSVIEGGRSARAGVFTLGSDRSRDTSVIRTNLRGFRSFGILLGQKEFGRPAAALHGLALDNVVSDIRDPDRDGCVYDAQGTPGCGTNEGGIWTGGVEAAIIGNTVLRARWDGIETVGSSTRTMIVDNEIRKTRTGIYLEHSTNFSVIARNLIVNSEAGIQVEWRYGGLGSSNNTFVSNRIVAAEEAGLFIDTGGEGNRILSNLFVGGARPAITLQGSSENVVRDNLGCGGRVGSLVGVETGQWDHGGLAPPRGNRLAGNRSVASC